MKSGYQKLVLITACFVGSLDAQQSTGMQNPEVNRFEHARELVGQQLAASRAAEAQALPVEVWSNAENRLADPSLTPEQRTQMVHDNHVAAGQAAAEKLSAAEKAWFENPTPQNAQAVNDGVALLNTLRTTDGLHLIHPPTFNKGTGEYDPVNGVPMNQLTGAQLAVATGIVMDNPELQLQSTQWQPLYAATDPAMHEAVRVQQVSDALEVAYATPGTPQEKLEAINNKMTEMANVGYITRDEAHNMLTNASGFLGVPMPDAQQAAPVEAVEEPVVQGGETQEAPVAVQPPHEEIPVAAPAPEPNPMPQEPSQVPSADSSQANTGE